jgi:hypothetical protein
MDRLRDACAAARQVVDPIDLAANEQDAAAQAVTDAQNKNAVVPRELVDKTFKAIELAHARRVGPKAL